MRRLQTRYWQVDPTNIDMKIIRQAAQLIREGQTVAFPTETVYGLGADGLNPEGVRRIFQAKGRPMDNPLILHVADPQDIHKLVATIPAQAEILIKTFWPGPLTLIMPADPGIPNEVTAGLKTVGIRMPAHHVALALIKEAGVPLAAPSANRSGYPSPTAASHVLADLEGKIGAVLDGGVTGLGLESTVLDLTEKTPTILRPGGITQEQLTAVLGEVLQDPGLENKELKPKSPGMKYTHYAPRADVFVLLGEPQSVAAKAQAILQENRQNKIPTALLLSSETWPFVDKKDAVYAREMGSHKAPEEIAHKLYHELRMCDQAGSKVILVEGYSSEGIGTAIMNRLLKSAGYRVIN
ncbi:MAG: L-threonylcarbamoyladenylate synthase [Peptococcia bacterium]